MNVSESRMDTNNFQRIGSASNTQAGNDFEAVASTFFAKQGILLVKNFQYRSGLGRPRRCTASTLAAKIRPCSWNASRTPGLKAAICPAPR